MRRGFRIVSMALIGMCVAVILIVLNRERNFGPEIPGDRAEDEGDMLKIGFSQTDRINPWRVIQVTSLKNAAVYRGYRLFYEEPENDVSPEWQIDNINQLMDKRVSYLILAPMNREVLDEAIRLCREQGVKLILLESDESLIDPDDYFTLVSTDYEKEGQICARLLAEYFGEREGRILEVAGPSGSVVADERMRGFNMETAKYPNLRIVYRLEGNFDRVTAQKSMEEIITNPSVDYNAIFACSDEDGLGVLQALKIAGKNNAGVPIVSINGIQDVLKAIIAGEYHATVESSPNLGEIVMQAIASSEEGYRGTKRIIVPYQIYDSSNAQHLFANAYRGGGR